MAEPDPPARKKRSSFVSKFVEWLLITLIAGGAGVAMTVANPPPPMSDDAAQRPPGKLTAAKKPAETSPAVAVCGPGGPSVLDMPPIVTNVAVPADTWVRLEASIVFDPKALPHPDVVAAEIATDELAFLRTVSVRELQGPVGLENIRQDLRDRASVRSGGKVTDLLLKTLVLQ